jgi:hypothetical protein
LFDQSLGPLGLSILNLRSLFSRLRASFSGRNGRHLHRVVPNDLLSQADSLEFGDAASQLRHVMAASFHRKKVMSKAEYKVFRVVESEIQTLRNGCRVLSQTSLGEIIGSDSEQAFRSINSKRVDVLIIGPWGDPIAAIEYQGKGHHQRDAAARDAIKREALRKAGIHFIEIDDSHSPDEIAQSVRRILRQPEPMGGSFRRGSQA